MRQHTRSKHVLQLAWHVPDVPFSTHEPTQQLMSRLQLPPRLAEQLRHCDTASHLPGQPAEEQACPTGALAKLHAPATHDRSVQLLAHPAGALRLQSAAARHSLQTPAPLHFPATRAFNRHVVLAGCAGNMHVLLDALQTGAAVQARLSPAGSWHCVACKHSKQRPWPLQTPVLLLPGSVHADAAGSGLGAAHCPLVRLHTDATQPAWRSARAQCSSMRQALQVPRPSQ